MFNRVRDFFDRISPTNIIDRVSDSIAADKKRTRERNRTGKIDNSQSRVIQQIDRVSLFFGNDKRSRAKEKRNKNMVRELEKNAGLRETSKLSKAIDKYANFMTESKKSEAAKIRALKKKHSFIKSEREEFIESEKKRMERIAKKNLVSVEAEEAKRVKMAELEWANALDDGDFNTNIIPESVLEKLDQKNENWDGSEMVTVKREILLKAVKEDVKQQDPFRANRSRLNQKRKPKQQPTYSVEDDDFDIDNIPF